MRPKQVTRRVHMGFCEGDYPSNTHMCLIYKNEDERKSLIKKFIAAGFQDNDRIEYFYDEWSEQQILHELIDEGLERSEVERTSQLRFRKTEQAYHPDGSFTP